MKDNKLNNGTDKSPKTRNSYGSVVNKIMSESQLRLKAKLEREGVHWREVDRRINEIK